MIHALTDRKAELLKLSAIDSREASGKRMVDVEVQLRVQLDGDTSWIQSEEERKAVGLLLDRSRQLEELSEDGSNSFAVTVKTRFTAVTTVFAVDRRKVVLDGAVKGSVKVRVVDGALAVEWKLTGSLNERDFGRMGGFTRDDSLSISAEPTPTPLEAFAKTQGVDEEDERETD